MAAADRRRDGRRRNRSGRAAVVAAAVAGPGRRHALAAWSQGRLVAATTHARRELRSSAAVLRRPGRAGLLWAGSAASPALHAFILVAVYNSLSGGLAPLTVTLVYLVASTVAALLPSPGGFGSLDVTLVAGLVAVGRQRRQRSPPRSATDCSPSGSH